MKVHRGKRWDNFKINKKDFEKSFKKLLTNRKAHDIISELRLRTTATTNECEMRSILPAIREAFRIDP